MIRISLSLTPIHLWVMSPLESFLPSLDVLAAGIRQLLLEFASETKLFLLGPLDA